MTHPWRTPVRLATSAVVALLAPLVGACGGDSTSDASARDTTATTAEALVAEPTIFLVDAAGETSRLMRLEAGSWVATEVTPLPPSSRGLAADPVEGGLIWASREGDMIQRGSLDGTDIETLPITGLDSAYAVAVGPESGALYWSDYGTDRIVRWDRGATEPAIVAAGLASPRALALDEAGGWIYWVDRGAARVQRAPVRGGTTETLVDEGLAAPYGIAFDAVDGTLLVADAELGAIFRVAPGRTTLEPWLDDAGTHPSFVLVDGPSGFVYWTDNRDNVVRRRLRTGGPVEVLAQQGLVGPRGLVLVR